MNAVIAVDFDGCLCENKWPNIGEANTAIIRTLVRRRESGDKLILWTCRTGERLQEAVAWCAEEGLVFDAINENLPDRIRQYGGDCRKVSADEYWDDRAVVVRFPHQNDQGSSAKRESRPQYHIEEPVDTAVIRLHSTQEAAQTESRRRVRQIQESAGTRS